MRGKQQQAGSKSGKLCAHSALLALAKTAAGSRSRWLRVTVSSADNCEAPALEVVGSVRRGPDGFELDLLAARCRECDKWGAEDDSEVVAIPLPEPAGVYFNAEVIDELPPMEGCSCAEDGHGDNEVGPLADKADFAAELAPDASLGFETGDTVRGIVASKWFVHQGKPPHLHTLVWRRLAESTRKQHARWLRILKTMPVQWLHSSLGTAAIHAVLTQAKEAKWTSWATVASAISAIASALKRLPEYTNGRTSIDLLNDDVVFTSAARRAQQLARVTKLYTTASAMS